MNNSAGNPNQTKVQKVMVQPITLIFKHFQSRARVRVWLYDHKDNFIDGQILGFDEFMNLVIDDASEVKRTLKKDEENPEENGLKYTSKSLGRILLKGDNISLIQSLDKSES